MDWTIFAIGALTLIVEKLPGYLASITGKETDAEALTHCKEHIDKIRRHPAATALAAKPE